VAWFLILIFLSQPDLREDLFFSNPRKYRIYYFNLRNEYLRKKNFEKLYKISQKAVQELGKAEIYYSDFLISRYFTKRKTEPLIDSIDKFFNKESVKRILFQIISLKYYELGEKVVSYMRKKQKNNKIYSEIMYRIYIEENNYKDAFRELKKFANKNVVQIELRRVAAKIDFKEIEAEFKDKEEFYPVLADIALLKGLTEKALNYFIKSKNEEKIKEYLEKNPSFIIKFTDKEKDPLISFYRAKAFEKEGDIEKAFEIYKKIEGKLEKYAKDINYSITKIYLEKKDLNEIEKRISKIENKDKKNLLLSIYNLLKGNPEKNFSILKNINTADGLFYLSLSYYFSKNFSRAETTFFKFIEKFSGDERVPDVLFLSYLLINFKNNLENYAEIHYKIFKGKDIEPPKVKEKIDYLYNLLYSRYLKQKGELDKSLKLLERISKGKEIPEIVKVKSLIETAEIYEKKDKNKAKEIYRDILLKYPENPFFPYIQERIKKL